ncbi:hypothetical protein RJ639_036727 [Escallonia herrerae]|uniref:Methyltransferase n=1 Tax=Escallonia herrerae TaxID=1293975 RepID=A0AA88WQ32_9ASTE|nr:hypothetical protein RJ639_036727 [Escallonia herrerae]
MKSFNSVDLFKLPTLLRISAFLFVSLACFYLGKRWSESDGYQQRVFFTSRQIPAPSVSLSPNYNRTFDLSSLIQNGTVSNQAIPSSPPISNTVLPPPPPPPVAVETFGVVDENGAMAEEFEVGEFDPDVVENWGYGNVTEAVEGGRSGGARVKVKKFGLCEASMREYIPCLDNVEAIKRLNSTKNGEKFERHCPGNGQGLSCLVPAPKGYRTPIPWPRSRDEIKYNELHYIPRCEPFDTYPRTYDFLHAAGLFSVEQKRCNISSIMLEMDRILRPGGRVYIRDSIAVIDELKEIGSAMGWQVSVRETAEGPHASYRILTCDKRLLRA